MSDDLEKDLEAYVDQQRASGKPPARCPVCGAAWEGRYFDRGSMNRDYFHGYVIQVGGYTDEPDICAACGATVEHLEAGVA